MDLLFVQEECSVAKSGMGTQGAAELSVPGMLAVLVVLKRLAVVRLIRAEFALKDRRLKFFACRVLQLHVVAQFTLSLAGVGTDLTNQ